MRIGLFSLVVVLVGVYGQSVFTQPIITTPLSEEEYHALAQEAFAEVLSRKEFANLHNERWRLPEWLRKFFERIASGFESFFNAIPAWVVYFILGWMILTLVAILVHIGYVLFGLLAPGKSSRLTVRTGFDTTNIIGIRNLEFHSVYNRAGDFFNRRDWVAAAKHFYVAGILKLVEEGQIDYKKSKTNQEYLRELHGRPLVLQPFSALTEIFESRVYGQRRPTKFDCLQMDSLVRSLSHEELHDQ